MSKIAAVQHVSVTSHVPGEWKTLVRVKLKKEGSGSELQTAYAIGADKDFLATYAIKLLKGRNFKNDNDTSAILINETAAKILGITDASNEAVEIPQSARGSFFAPLYDDVNASFKPRVVGIVKDFHFQSLRAKIEPLIIAYHDNPIYPIDYYSVNQKILRKLKELSGSEAELSRRVKQLSRLGTLRNISTVIIQEALAMAITLDKTKDGLYLLGKEEEKEEIALNLLKEGLAEEVISRVTGLSLREVSQLKQRLSGKQ